MCLVVESTVVGDRAMSATANALHSGSPCPLEREDKRQAIIEVARALAAERGFSAVTLSAVAEKMNFAPAVIYGYFATRNELLEHLSLDDSPEMEPAAAPAAASEPMIQMSEPAAKPYPDIAPPPESSAEMAPQDFAIPTDAAAAVESPSGEYGEMLKVQAEELAKLAQRVMVPKSLQREGTEAVLARIETRLHVVEQSYAELKKRLLDENAQLTHRLDDLTTSSQQLAKRMEVSEAHSQSAFAEIRLDLFNLAHPDAGKATYFPPDDAATGFNPDPVVNPKPQDAVVEGLGRFSFLSSARVAAQVSAAPHDEESVFAAWRKLIGAWGKKQLEVAALALLVAAGVGLGAWRFVPSHEAVKPSHPATLPAATSDPVLAIAAASSPKDELLLGVRLLTGNGMAIDVAKGAKIIELAAQRGQPVAQNYIGVLYQTGTGVTADMATAVRWYKAAAGQGNRMAMANLGKLYAGGWKAGTDYNAAVRWFTRAAKLGDTDAAFNLAVLYERGDGVPFGLINASKWYFIAAAQGDRYAEARAAELADTVPHDDYVMAKMMAADFKAAPLDRAANDLPVQAAPRG
jgi:TPR repeat protein